MAKKYITDEILEAELIKRGFGEKDTHDEEHVRKVVLDHYGVELTNDWNASCDYYIYTDTTADGYEIFVCTHDERQVHINENVFYYDSDLGRMLEEAIYDGYESIYISMLDDEEYWIQDTINEIFMSLYEIIEREIKDVLIDEGYEEYEIKK
jgi:hypothetical protein